jgi:hypothetical protein
MNLNEQNWQNVRAYAKNGHEEALKLLEEIGRVLLVQSKWIREYWHVMYDAGMKPEWPCLSDDMWQIVHVGALFKAEQDRREAEAIRLPAPPPGPIVLSRREKEETIRISEKAGERGPDDTFGLAQRD